MLFSILAEITAARARLRARGCARVRAPRCNGNQRDIFFQNRILSSLEKFRAALALKNLAPRALGFAALIQPGVYGGLMRIFRLRTQLRPVTSYLDFSYLYHIITRVAWRTV